MANMRVRTGSSMPTNMSSQEARWSHRIHAIFAHPNCPVTFIDERERLDTARFVASRMVRISPNGKYRDDEDADSPT